MEQKINKVSEARRNKSIVWCCDFCYPCLQSKVDEMAGEIVDILSAEEVGAALTKDDLFVDVSELFTCTALSSTSLGVYLYVCMCVCVCMGVCW